MTWSDHILDFLNGLELDRALLPEDILPLYPLKSENAEATRRLVTAFYRKYYSDRKDRRFIIGINPGRLGAGATGIPFTDTKRLESVCGITTDAFRTHEPSSVFIYEMIDAYGGPDAFYDKFYITSVSPIGFVRRKEGGKSLNYNYYDSVKFTRAIEPFIIEKMEEQLAFGADTSVAYCLGTGKNFKYLDDLNRRHPMFERIVPLEHPRYIMQYKNKFKEDYIDKYLAALGA